MINETINRKIIGVWKKRFGTQDVYAPIFYDEFKPGGIIFVGMNPSVNSRGLEKALRGTECENMDVALLERWPTIAANPERVNDSLAVGRYVTTHYGYFKRMHEIAKSVNTHIHHLDLFVYRQTSQKDFLSFIRDGKRGHEFNDFGKDQLAVFHDALVATRPRAIVVANAFASQVLRREFARDLSFDDGAGFHWLKLDGQRVPIFFSSMLSGQRALDTGSYERLKWHVGQAVNTKPRD